MSDDGLQIVFGTGQVGNALAAYLAGLGHPVRTVSRHRPAALAGVDWRSADAADPEAAADAAKGAAVIYQCLNAPYNQWPERFRPFFNPATGEWITYTAVAEDNNGQLVRFTWRSVPGGVITEHIHPRQEERFTIVAGQAHFTLNGQEYVAGAGETVVVPAGVPHSEGNPGPAEIEGIVELRPALRAKELHEAFAGLVADGKTTPRGAPHNPLQLGATFWHFRHESRVTSPPIWAQNLMLPPLWALARVFGVRPYYDRWDSRIPD